MEGDENPKPGPSRPLIGGFKPSGAYPRVANPSSNSRSSSSGPSRSSSERLKLLGAEANNWRHGIAYPQVANPFSNSRSSSSGSSRSSIERLKLLGAKGNNGRHGIAYPRVANPFSNSRSYSSDHSITRGNGDRDRDRSISRNASRSGLTRDLSRGRPHNSGIENSSHRGRADFLGRPRGNHQSSGSLGFMALKRIADADKTRVLTVLNQSKKEFMNLINSPIHDLDIFVVIIEILSELSQSPFEESKSKIILDVCNSNFITSLRNYLMDLPYAQKKPQNRLYWENEGEFWKNFVIFCGEIVAVSPTTAARTCRALIESISKTCLEGLNQNHGYVLDDDNQLRLEEIRKKLAACANKNKDTKDSKAGEAGNEEITPPEDFRELNVVPTREDLLEFQPFLRPNITDGGYTDVEHYLDVQFRLLREDCFGPIRVGVDQYLSNPNKWKYDHVRVYRNVKFSGPYITNLKIGYLIQIDTSNKSFRRINWAQSKRFLFGSLVILTKDRFQNCIVATVLDRDNMLLSMGKIAISIIDTTFGVDINSEDTYTMIESEVYYEPYYHVLRALQAPLFADQLPMQEYIVKVDANSKTPAYLTDETVFSYHTESPESSNSGESSDDDIVSSIFEKENLAMIKFNVLNTESWPSKEILQFNESQYEAFKLALTHKFAVIQGPPGTGKTYVGLKVAKTLLQNVKATNGAVMLVVCYTNHALDQFLEGISKVTQHIVRIGSQSRNAAMDKFNLANIRKLRNVNLSGAGKYFMEIKAKLKKSIDDFQETLLQLDILNNGVISFKAISIPQIQFLCNYYDKRFSNIKDPLAHWLFENCPQYYGNLNECIKEYGELNLDENDNEFNKKRKEYAAVVTNDDKDAKKRMESLKKTYNTFLLIDAKRMLKNLVDSYNKSQQQSSNTYKLEIDILNLNSQIKLFEDMMKCRGRTVILNINNMTDFSRISTENRWCLYFMWTRKIVQSLEQQLESFQESISSDVVYYEEARMMMDMELLKHQKIKVLGLTTSGAARMRKLIHAISPNIVIVEEAAEVLEQHIITSLPKTCHHLILIGDHQQLRPSASYMKLVKRYNIEVSLFERMITNGIHSRTLNVQHRMRPEIAALISPHIYPQLANHPSVETFGDVPGLEKNVFFFTHEHAEEEQANEASSRANHKEGNIILALANYLIQQGYKSDEVTILAAYSGQMFYMRRERKKFVLLTDVKITVVDNYQGEESRIILLSLVRNNSENNIGFLGIENRICVALSRAKQGFYIFGNINMLKMKSELWTKIAATLVDIGALGTVLNLKCQNHPDQITPVVNEDDFKNAPEGGCTRICNYQYQCGHRCTSFCHGYDRQHKDAMKCPNKCERILCDLNHVCPLLCRETCAPCKVYVPKILPCGHEQKVYCHREPDDPENKCLFEIEITLPLCGHKARKLCHTNLKEVICQEKCKLRLEKCGHTCELICHVGKTCSEFDYLCKKECAKANKDCQAELTEDLGDHKCKKKCYEACDNCNVQVVKRRSTCRHLVNTACSDDIDSKLCYKKCARVITTCGHHCMRKCHEECGDCRTMVEKEIPDCKHTIKVMCKIEVTRELCYDKCQRTRSCGHPCTSRCGVDCELTKCTHLTAAEVDSPCGHKTKLPCHMYDLFNKGELKSREILKYCINPCRKDLACGHICNGTCADCHQGRLHIPCKQTCNQLNICGHQCQEPCNQMCPPCNMPCEVRCAHSRCSRPCGQPCVQCKEKCDRRCAHSACNRLCSQACAVEACSLPCPRTLPCGHRCRGVCGEPCLNICQTCRPEEFPRGFIGEEYEEDAIFILLQDCGHIVELESMDSIMLGEQEIIKLKDCPYCRKPVINTNRYKQLVNDMIRKKINPIKRRIYGKDEAIMIKFKELQFKISAVHNKYFQDKSKEDKYNLKKIFLQFINFMKGKKKFYLLQVEMLIIYCYIIETVTECWQAYAALKTTILETEFRENIEMLLKVLKIDYHSKKYQVEVKISKQQQKDVDYELKRLNVIVQLAKLFCVESYASADANIKSCVDDAKATVFTLSIFDEEKAIECLKSLKTAIKSSDIITKLERAMVIKAMPDMRAGHWFTCPNGHFYCIGECGGANQIGKCPDCGAAVGGTQHRLLPGNSHTGALDGSRYAAYSEEANNMANFLLQGDI